MEVAQRVRPALIFAVKCSFFHPETIRQIRKSAGVPFVNHYPDHPYIGIRWDPREASALRRDLIEVLRQYSIVWMWEHSLVERLRRDGVEAKYLPFAVDPEISPSAICRGGIALRRLPSHTRCRFCRDLHALPLRGSCRDPETHDRHLGQ